MAKSKNHTNHNQGHKNHRNGVKLASKHRHGTTRGMNAKFLRNQRFAKKHNPHHRQVASALKELAKTAAVTTVKK